LLEQFIASNQHRPAIFAQVDGAVQDKFSGTVADRLHAEYEKHKARPSIEESLDRIDFEQGWNSEDILVVSKANTDEIERLLRNSEGGALSGQIENAVEIGTLQDSPRREKHVS